MDSQYIDFFKMFKARVGTYCKHYNLNDKNTESIYVDPDAYDILIMNKFNNYNGIKINKSNDNYWKKQSKI